MSPEEKKAKIYQKNLDAYGIPPMLYREKVPTGGFVEPSSIEMPEGHPPYTLSSRKVQELRAKLEELNKQHEALDKMNGCLDRIVADAFEVARKDEPPETIEDPRAKWESHRAAYESAITCLESRIKDLEAEGKVQRALLIKRNTQLADLGLLQIANDEHTKLHAKWLEKEQTLQTRIVELECGAVDDEYRIKQLVDEVEGQRHLKVKYRNESQRLADYLRLHVGMPMSEVDAIIEGTKP